MATPLSRIGLHINANKPGDSEKLLGVLRAWKPAGVLVMNALNARDPGNIVMRILRTMQEWDGIVIYRPYEKDEGHLWRIRSAQAHVDMLVGLGSKAFWFNVGNEPAPDAGKEREAMDRWYAEFIQRAGDAGLRTVIPGGFAAVSFDKHEVDRGDFDRMFRALGERADDRVQGYNRAMFGVHVYGHALMPLMTGGRDPRDLLVRERIQPDQWPKAEDIFDADQSDNWLLFREEWYISRIKQLTGKVPDTAITECFFDRMPNLEEQFPDMVRQIDQLAERWVKGIPTLRKYWEWAFLQTQGWGAAQALCKQLVWWEQIAPPHYRMATLWAWTWHNDAPEYWKDTGNIGEWDTFLNLWPSYAQLIDAPAPQPSPLPTPDDPRWQDYSAEPKLDSANVREQPTVASAVIGKIGRGGVKVGHIPYEVLTPEEKALADQPGYRWHLVKLLNPIGIGWVRSDVVTLEAISQPPEPPLFPVQIYKDWRARETALLKEAEDDLVIHQTRIEGHKREIERLDLIIQQMEE